MGPAAERAVGRLSKVSAAGQWWAREYLETGVFHSVAVQLAAWDRELGRH